MSTLLGLIALLAMAASGIVLMKIALSDDARSGVGHAIAVAMVGAIFMLAVLGGAVVVLVRGGLPTLWLGSMPALRGLIWLLLALGAAGVVVVGSGMLPGRDEAVLAVVLRRAIWIGLLALLLVAMASGLFPALAGGSGAWVQRSSVGLMVLATLVGAPALVHQWLTNRAAEQAASERRFPGSSSPSTDLWKRADGRWAYDGTPFDAADANTLKPLSGEFAHDSVQGYYRGHPIPGSQGPSFQVLGKNEARDQQAVYWADTYRKGQEYWLVRHVRIETLPGVDPARYQVLRYGYGRDDRHAYFEGKRLPNVQDGASFEVLTPRLARDARRAYYEHLVIPGSDGASFEVIDPHDPAWVRDQRRAWHVSSGTSERGGPLEHRIRPLEQVRPATLRPLGRLYASDGHAVWHEGRRVSGADAASFAVIDDGATSGAEAVEEPPDARDARATYRKGVRVNGGP